MKNQKKFRFLTIGKTCNGIFSLIFVNFFSSVFVVKGSLLGCHDDPTYVPEEGPLGDVQFTWLGGLQYIHIKNGSPHYFRLPRVVMITQSFALSTASDATNVPDGYALGNVIFGDYERDEEECSLTLEEIARGSECNPAVLLMPIVDVLLHPEFKHFGMKKSLALLRMLKPIKSKYMVPVCLPLEDFVMKKTMKSNQTFYHIDYSSVVPRDFEEEDKELMKLRILPADQCYILQKHKNKVADIYRRENQSDPVREMCTNNCGLRSGAPTIVHEDTGHWTLVALAEGGSPCPDPLGPRQSSSPPVHILIYPYVQWITTAIVGRSVEKNDPFGPELRAKTSYDDRTLKGWIGKWWMAGLRCYDRGQMAADLFKFYHEVFLVHPNPVRNGKINYYIEVHKTNLDSHVLVVILLNAPLHVRIVCIKVGIPHRIGTPTVWGLYSFSAKVRIKLLHFYLPYKVEMEAWGSIPDPDQSED